MLALFKLSVLQAQPKIDWLIGAGANYSNLLLSTTNLPAASQSNQYGGGFYFGGGVRFTSASEKWLTQVGLEYAKKRASVIFYEENFKLQSNTTYSINYLQLPVTVFYSLGERFDWLQTRNLKWLVGATVNMSVIPTPESLRGTQTVSITSPYYNNSSTTPITVGSGGAFDILNFNAGISTQLEWKLLFFSLGYQIGIFNSSNLATTSSHPSVFTVGVGVILPSGN